MFPFEYDLILKPDVNTQGHTQWFYFSVSRMVPGIKYKFNIINLLKPDSLYNHGMQPVVFSTVNAEVRQHAHSGARSVAGSPLCVRLEVAHVQAACAVNMFESHPACVCVCRDCWGWQRRGVGWARKGTDVCYYQNSIRRKGGYYYTATFSMIFEHSNDTVYIAHSYPYTYTDLQRCGRCAAEHGWVL